MASLVGVTTNTTTAKPTEMRLKCPFLTHEGYDPETNLHFCDYEPWAYGVFAIACLLLIMVPLVFIICCIVRTRNKNKRARRLRSNVTSNSYSSCEAPYQPLMQDRRRGYGAVEQDCGSSSRISPNDESVSERPSQQHDNTSTTSSKASLLPNYDQASLDFRNSAALNAPKNSESLANPVIPIPSYNFGTDLISPSRDVPSKTKSPIYAVLEEASPDERLNKGAKGLTVATDHEPLYSVLESPENNDSIVPGNNHENVESNEQLLVPGNGDEEKKAFSENVKKCLDDLNTIPKVKYAPNEESNMLEPEPQDLVPSQKDVDNINNSPIYSILEPPLPKVPEQEQNPVIEKNENLVKEKPEVNVQTNDKSDDKLCAEDTTEETYTPLLPPRERPPGNAPNSGNYQALAPKPRLRLTSRTDYEEFLLDMIKSFPEAERNGTFVVRDSVTNPGSKALTVYNKSPNSEKDVFNFKVCFDDKGQAYLAKSTKRFPSLEQLLQHLRTDKDMLPCTLRNQLN